MIIGLTGKNAAGKGEVASYLKKNGFSYFSLSDAIRDEATKMNIEHSRNNLIMIGNELRKNYGPGILAKKISEKVEGKCVIDSIRNPFEIEELRKLREFTLFGIDAPIELRFKRAIERGRVENAKTLEEFKAIEEKENHKNKNYQQLDECLKRANKIIINDSTIDYLHKKIKEAVGELR